MTNGRSLSASAWRRFKNWVKSAARTLTPWRTQPNALEKTPLAAYPSPPLDGNGNRLYNADTTMVMDPLAAGVLPSRELLERISVCEQQYHLAIRYWALPQLRVSRYWSRRQLWDVLGELTRLLVEVGQLRGAMDEALAALSTTTSQDPPGSPRLFPFDKDRPMSPGGTTFSSGKNGQPLCDVGSAAEATVVQPRVAVNRFLSAYYLTLCELQETIGGWRAAIQEIVDNVK